MFLDNKERVDSEIDKQCDFILQKVKQLLELIKLHKKQRYGTDNLLDRVLRLKN